MKGEIEMSVIKDITGKVTGTARAAAHKSGDLVQVTKLNMSIGTEEDKIEKIYTEIGKGVYELFSSSVEVNDVLKEKCEAIKSINDNIQEMKNKILDLKDLKNCPNCNTELQKGIAYCYTCGTKQ